MQGRSIANLDALLKALDDMGVITYIDCGSYFTVKFDKEVNSYGDKLGNAEDIRFYGDSERFRAPIVEADIGTCDSSVDVHFERDTEPY